MATEKNVGRIVEIKGVVIDAAFHGELPSIYRRPAHPGSGAGRPSRGRPDRGGAAAPRQRPRQSGGDGLHGRPPARAEVEDTGAPITVPVGQATLGRIFNVLGEAIDEGEEVEGGERWPIHRPAPSFEELEPTVQIFETGIKVIDLLAPLREGRQGRRSSAAPAWARRCSSRS